MSLFYCQITNLMYDYFIIAFYIKSYNFELNIVNAKNLYQHIDFIVHSDISYHWKWANAIVCKES